MRMTREELREHCERQIQQFERIEKIMPVTLNDWKRYEEHKLILELLEQKPKTWSLDDAREDFKYDVYNTLDFLPTNDEANRIIDSFDRITSSIEQEPILEKIIAEIKEWYWQADKQKLAEDPCVVDAMIDLFIRTIDKYKSRK